MWAKSNLASGVVFLTLGVLALAVLIPLGIESPPSLQFRALSPSFWPNTVGVVISVIGLALIASSVLDRSSNANQPVVAGEQRSVWLSVRPYLVMVVCFVLYLSLETFGFVLVPTIAMAVLMAIGGERRIWLIALISIITPLALYVFFTKATGLAIPTGVLENLLLRI
ncbi:MAG: tripartite tricarboxylate transporter TctB family protein [Hyphomicrobiaceae bacterium]